LVERGFSMRDRMKINACSIICFVVLSSWFVTITASAVQMDAELGCTQYQRHDYLQFSTMTPSGWSSPIQVKNFDTVLCFNELEKTGHQSILSSMILRESFMMDGTDWSNAGGNAHRNGLSETKGPLAADLLWSGGRSSLISWLPVTEQNRLFVVRQAGWPGAAHDSPVIAMDLSTGAELWAVEIPAETNDWTTWVGGVMNGKVYASRSGNGASVQDNLYALDASTGDILWISTVLIDAGPYDGVVFASDGDPIIASFTDIWRFNSEDGVLVWHADRVGSVSGSCGGALFQNRFYVADAAPGGTIIVCYDVQSGQRLYESQVMTGFTVQNTPFVGPDGTIYLSRTQNNPVTDFFYAFTDTGTGLVEQWHQPCAWTTFSEFATGTDGSVYCILPGPRIGKLNASTGEILAESMIFNDSDPYLSPHFAVDAAGTVYYSNGGFSDGRVLVFTSNLSLLWNTTMTNINIGGPSLGKDGVLLLCGTGTNMRAYQARQPQLQMNITAVFPHIGASITNTGDVAATNLRWNLSVTGGVLGRVHTTNVGTIASLGSMEYVNVSLDRMVFGFGWITISATVNCDEGVFSSDAMDAFVFLFFIKMVS
jgi:hypothetical protein